MEQDLKRVKHFASMATSLRAAVKEKDDSLGEYVLRTLRLGPPPTDYFTEELCEAVLAWQQYCQTKSVTVVTDPDTEIEEIEKALNTGKVYRAQRGMKELQASWGVGGPHPSEEGKKKLARLVLRQDWSL